MFMYFVCPECGKKLPIGCSVWKKDQVHKIHVMVDELNAGQTAKSDGILARGPTKAEDRPI